MKKLLVLALLAMVWGCTAKTSKITDASKIEAAVNLFMAEHPNPGVAHQPNGGMDDGSGTPFGKGDINGDGWVTIEDFYAEYALVWHHSGVAWSATIDIHCDGVINDADVYYFSLYNGGEFGADPAPIACQP